MRRFSLRGNNLSLYFETKWRLFFFGTSRNPRSSSTVLVVNIVPKMCERFFPRKGDLAPLSFFHHRHFRANLFGGKSRRKRRLGSNTRVRNLSFRKHRRVFLEIRARVSTIVSLPRRARKYAENKERSRISVRTVSRTRVSLRHSRAKFHRRLASNCVTATCYPRERFAFNDPKHRANNRSQTIDTRR